MKILALETTCDDTGIALLEFQERRMKILFNFLLSQVEIHQKFGGVVPHLAGQRHRLNLKRGLEKLSKIEKGRDWKDCFDYLAFACKPGLMPCLLAGKEMVQTLGLLFNKPILLVNHIQAHLYSPLIEEGIDLRQKLRSIKFPVICLTVSGGHTMLVLIKDYFQEEILGTALDDAAGEAFDKVGRMLGLGYPAGSALEAMACLGDPEKFSFPRPMQKAKNYNFSFAGLKTAVLYKIRELNNFEEDKNDLAASFQAAVIDILVYKTIRALEEYQAKTVFLSGGVSNNKELKENLNRSLQNKCSEIKLLLAEPKFRQDNAVMIGFLGYLKNIQEKEQAQNKKGQLKTRGVKWSEVEVDTSIGIN